MDNENIVQDEQKNIELEEQVSSPQEEKPAPLVSAPEVNTEEIALETAEEMSDEPSDEVVTLENGYKVKYHPVSPNILYAVQVKILDPGPPMQDHPSGTGQKVPNETHPDYLRALRETELKRAEAIQDALFIFGLELISPMPEDSDWLDNLVLAGLIDEGDAVRASYKHKELWFKKYIVATTSVYTKMGTGLGVSEEGIAQAGAAFKSNAP